MSEALVRIVDLHKSYRLGETSLPALRGVTLNVERGAFTALVGPSGSGKSTLLNMAGCIDEPDSGSVYLDGMEISRLDDRQKSDLRNRKIGFIFQSFNLVPVLDVFENVELPLLINPEVSPEERRRRVLSALSDVEMEKFHKNRPDQLSGGQRQRVAIARALAGHPALVIADEPTANLDSVTSRRVIDLMLDLNATKKITFLFSTHDERLMERVSRIVHIQDGQVVT